MGSGLAFRGSGPFGTVFRTSGTRPESFRTVFRSPDWGAGLFRSTGFRRASGFRLDSWLFRLSLRLVPDRPGPFGTGFGWGLVPAFEVACLGLGWCLLSGPGFPSLPPLEAGSFWVGVAV